MKTFRAALMTLVAASSVAHAGKHAILVLKSDGNADGKVKAKVDAAVVKLAQQAPDGSNVTPGDISYADAAAAAGCKPEAPACANEVIATFATDEIVIVNVAKKPGALDITVRRATKSAKPREITASVPDGTPDLQLDAVNTLFGLAAPPPVVVAPVTPPPIAATTNPPPLVGDPTTPPAITTTPDHPIETAPPVDPTTPPNTSPTGPTAGGSTSQPPGPGPDDDDGGHTKLYVGGMVAGGVFALLGMGLWSSAGDIQNQIDSAPKKTLSDLKHVQDLESQGDSKANAGNVMFVIGVGVGAVATYLFIRDRHKHAAAQQHAMIGPTLFDHGAGIAFTFGPTP